MEPLALNGIPPYSSLSSGSEDIGRDSAARARGKGRSVELLLDRVDEVELIPSVFGAPPEGAVDESAAVDFKSQLLGFSNPAQLESNPAANTGDAVHASAPLPAASQIRFWQDPDVPGEIQIEILDPATLDLPPSIRSEARKDLALRYQEPLVNPLGAEVDTQA